MKRHPQAFLGLLLGTLLPLPGIAAPTQNERVEFFTALELIQAGVNPELLNPLIAQDGSHIDPSTLIAVQILYDEERVDLSSFNGVTLSLPLDSIGDLPLNEIQ